MRGVSLQHTRKLIWKDGRARQPAQKSDSEAGGDREEMITKDTVRRQCSHMIVGATPPTQQVGAFVHVADQVVSSRRQLLEERVCVAIEGQVFDATFRWGAGEKRQQRKKVGLEVTGKGIKLKYVLNRYRYIFNMHE